MEVREKVQPFIFGVYPPSSANLLDTQLECFFDGIEVIPIKIDIGFLLEHSGTFHLFGHEEVSAPWFDQGLMANVLLYKLAEAKVKKHESLVAGTPSYVLRFDV